MLNVISVLREELAGALTVPVYVSVPAERPDAFILLNRGGGAWENSLIDRAGINLYAYGQTEGAAYDLLAQACEAIRALTFDTGICSVAMENMRSDYDIDAKTPRWYASLTVKNYKPKEH